MFTARAVLCSVIFVIICKNCDSLQPEYNDVVDNVLMNEDSLVPETDHGAHLDTADVIHVRFIENPNDDLNKSDENKVELNIEGNDVQDSIDDGDISDEEIKRRVARQAYSGQTQLYPNLQLNSPYNQFQQYPNYPTYNHTTNPYHQPANSNYAFGQNSSYGQYNNHYQHPNSNFSSGAPPNYNNGNFSVGYKPYNDGVSSRPPYSRPGQFNSSYSGYSHVPSYGSPNTTHNFNSSTGFYPGSPYNPQHNYSNSRHPILYDNSAHVPGYNYSGSTSRPHNVTNFNIPSGRSPYNTPTNSYPYNSNSHHNYSSHNGQSSTTPKPWFGQNVPNSNNSSWRPPYQTPNNQFPNSNPYNSQYPYGGNPSLNNTNLNQWSQNTTYSNNPSDRNPYRPPNDKYPQNYYPTPSPYGSGNNNQAPYGNTPNGYNNNQYDRPGYSGGGNQGPYGNPSNGYNNNQFQGPGYSGGGNQGPYGNPSNGYNNNQYYPQTPDTFNLVNGYNPRIPDRPPYGHNNIPSNNQDLTKVSPEYFNSYK